MWRKLMICVACLLLLGGAGTITWTLLEWPPPGLVIEYGIPPYCEPTGGTMTVEGIEFVEIGPGCFRMGSDHLAQGGNLLGRFCAEFGLPFGDQPKTSNEMPRRWVELRRPFWIARYEITNRILEEFCPNRERGEMSPGDQHPANVSWDEAIEFCKWITNRSGLEVRLPSEAEWEAACRAGSTTEFCFTEASSRLTDYAWIDVNAGGTTREVGTRKENGWGLHDLHGNAWEWCLDTYRPDYGDALEIGAAKPGLKADGSQVLPRVFRGGNCSVPADQCRSAVRFRSLPMYKYGNSGFRPVMQLPPPQTEAK